jgi:hypothetical protein
MTPGCYRAGVVWEDRSPRAGGGFGWHGAVAVAILLPLSPAGTWFGLVAPSPLYFAYLAGATVAYLALVEIIKWLFYRRVLRG